jgi:two-component system response regulator (stage 0 sporulation protein A)
MTVIERKINALSAYVLAEDDESRESAKKALQGAMRMHEEEGVDIPSDVEVAVHEFLMEVGAQPHLIGYKYMVFAITQAIQDPNIMDNMVYGLYPLIAKTFNTTVSKAESRIRRVVEKTYDAGSYAALEKYFHDVLSLNQTKPSNSQFIAIAARAIRLLMKK